ncbi:cytochrome c [Steroidobacter sp. S1-65]|uniref:Cytochrome c n=1 Tax=Steroidobacter gossypii TaxID=2805490 RepID=A0ABS1WSD4_9GAMM|nr:cytochrome c [Steroidobacter gossypii]MBM0103884.1 cytochrome c [Steroidobacter gossypii]
MNRMLRSAVVATLLVPAVTLLAQASEPANVKQLQKDRHEHYEKLGEQFKVVRDQVRVDKPDLAAIKTAAKFVSAAAAEQEKWFPAGSGPEAGKTDALPAIWAKPAEFKKAMQMFSDAAPKLQAAADSGNVAAIKTAFGDVGKACKNCHEQFRADD